MCEFETQDYVGCDGKVHTLVLVDRYIFLGFFLGRNNDISIEQPHYLNTKFLWWWVSERDEDVDWYFEYLFQCHFNQS